MEREIVQLLADTQSPHEGPRKNAELQLRQLYTNDGFASALISIAAKEQFGLQARQSALLYLKRYIQEAWSPQLEEYKGQTCIENEDERKRIRNMLLELSTTEGQERKIKSAASSVVSKIATVDWPDQWPELLPTVLHVINNGSDGQIHGAMKVLMELVDDCFGEDQFFKVARDLVSTVYHVAINHARSPILRALAVSVFRSCFDILEMVMEDHKAAVKGFAEETLSDWFPFFIATLKAPLPPAPVEGESDAAVSEQYRGLVALKLQVVKVLMRVRSVFPAALAPQSPQLFSATWDELNTHQAQYHQMYIEDDRQGRLEDADGLPYTLDFLVLEELDFMQACLRAPPVRKELEKQLANSTGPENWVTEVMKLAVAYAQITNEEEALWEIDVNIFLSEESNVTANYTPRAACGDLVIKLGEWQHVAAIQGLLHHTQSLFSTNTDWKAKESALYVLNQLLGDMQDVDKQLTLDAANGYLDFTRFAMDQKDSFLRARGYLVAGSLIKTSGDFLLPAAGPFMESSLYAISDDPSEVVKVACIRALQSYLAATPPDITLPLQPAVIAAIADYLSQQDLSDLDESEDIMIAIVETLRDAILLDTTICLTGQGLDVLFTVASHGASNFQLSMLITETFEEATEALSAGGPEVYAALCAKVLPSLSGAFDLGNLTEENALTNLAAEMLSVLAENGSTPLPQGFVVTTMPKLNRLLLESNDEELLKAATSAVKFMLEHDPDQMFSWQNADGKGGLEVILIIIDRLLSPTVDDHAAAEVGGLAAELVEKAGSERLGPYLTHLLGAVAVRLSTASAAQFIQSLILVFARLSLVSAREVVDFLSQLQVESQAGLQVVLSKWLENSVNFAGYDEIRQNVTALCNLYNLSDPRLDQVHVQGDLIVNPNTSGRIMTRSRARQNPDQYTIIPASLKIVKVLVEELIAASGARQSQLDTAAAAELEDEDSDGGDDWEDEDNGFLDLGAGMTKEQLMAYAAEDGPMGRGRDDETQGYLVRFFTEQANKPEFAAVFNALTPDEQDKLRSMNE
ncbi:armadillo-type protein [Delphinella strobiligena]|nr:armadillo-type protein [Delphinella strobiligena]